MEATLFHAAARGAETVFEVKGRAAVTENYSVFSPEVRRLGGRTVGAFNERLFDLVMGHDRVYVFGQAKSHCVRATLLDLMEECQRRDPALLRKVHVLEDAMSPVPAPPLDPLPAALDFPRVADEALRTFAAAGMQIVRSRDPV
jgi:nicotinamidase-related amidase